MRSFRPLREWPRALSARRLVLLATVAGLGVAGAAIGPLRIPPSDAAELYG